MPPASHPADYTQQLEAFNLSQLTGGEDYWKGIGKTPHWKSVRDSVQGAIKRGNLVTLKFETLRIVSEMHTRGWPLPKTLEDFHRLDNFGQTGFLLLHFLNSNLFTKTWLDVSIDINDESDIPQGFYWGNIPSSIGVLSEHSNFLARVLESDGIPAAGYDITSLHDEQKERINLIRVYNWALKTIPKITLKIKNSIQQSDNTKINWSNFTINLGGFNYGEQMLLIAILFSHNMTPEKTMTEITRCEHKLKTQNYTFSRFQEGIDVWTELMPSDPLPPEIAAALSIGLLRGCTDDIRSKRPDLM